MCSPAIRPTIKTLHWVILILHLKVGRPQYLCMRILIIDSNSPEDDTCFAQQFSISFLFLSSCLPTWGLPLKSPLHAISWTLDHCRERLPHEVLPLLVGRAFEDSTQLQNLGSNGSLSVVDEQHSIAS